MNTLDRPWRMTLDDPTKGGGCLDGNAADSTEILKAA